jgi:hypothetical protein
MQQRPLSSRGHAPSRAQQASYRFAIAVRAHGDVERYAASPGDVNRES